MRSFTGLVFLVVLSMAGACGDVETKPSQPSNVSTNNGNNAVNATTNNGTTNNMINLCGPDPRAPERLLGFAGFTEGTASGVVTAVSADQLTVEGEVTEYLFFADGLNLQNFFSESQTVELSAATTETGQGRNQSVSGPDGTVEYVAYTGAFDEDSVRLSASTGAEFGWGMATSEFTCLLDVGCGDTMQLRTDSQHEVDVMTDFGDTTVAPGTSTNIGNFAVAAVSSSRRQLEAIETETCQAEGSDRAVLEVFIGATTVD